MKLLAICFVMALAVMALTGAAPVDSIRNRPLSKLYCDKTAIAYVDGGGYPTARKATLRGNAFSILLLYGVDVVPGSSARELVPQRNPWPLGFKLDGGPIIGIDGVKSSLAERAPVLALSELSLGKHRIAIGLINASGQLQGANSYCFIVPGNIDWTGRGTTTPGIP